MKKLYKIRCRKRGIITTAEPEKHDVVWKRKFDPERSPIDRKTLESNLINTEIMSKEVKEKEKKLNPFEQSIKDYLDNMAKEDELFAVTYAKPNKSIKECCNYVMKCAKEGGRQGYTDPEVFGWAVHYYDEDDIKNVKAPGGKVIVNRDVELSEADKKKAKDLAIQIATNEKVEEIKKDLKVNVELSPEEIAEAKAEAIKKITDDQREKMLKKKVKKEAAPTDKKEEQGSLF